MVVPSYRWLVRKVLILATPVRVRAGPSTSLGITQLVEWRIVVDYRLLSNKTPHVAGSIPAPEIFKKGSLAHPVEHLAVIASLSDSGAYRKVVGSIPTRTVNGFYTYPSRVRIRSLLHFEGQRCSVNTILRQANVGVPCVIGKINTAFPGYTCIHPFGNLGFHIKVGRFILAHTSSQKGTK